MTTFHLQGRHDALRAGWLLACDSPQNVAKGEAALECLTKSERSVALDYRDACLASYDENAEVSE